MQRFESFYISRVCSHKEAQKTQRAKPSTSWFTAFVFFVPFCGYMALFAADAKADDGYRLWLRYDQVRIKSVAVEGNSPTFDVIRNELSHVVNREGKISVVVRKQKQLDPEGFRIRTVGTVVVIAGGSDVGALYGAFHFLRLLQTGQPLQADQQPKLKLRLLNHWDNLDRTIERGYAGQSLWKWEELPDRVDPRLVDYARANASIGINGTVLNNVNANSQILTREYLEKVAAIANIFRPYGIRVYLSARFSAPIDVDKLATADPLEPSVAAWWQEKADEIYKLIPDFGGFLVKANSEGQPGPRTYSRTHADGANMLADAVAPHGGIVMWRAFVYDMQPGYDRAGAAYENLHPFDGKFRPNVLLQVKNGPVDFQPREPFHPLFGGMPHTQVMPEFQITQEYLGFSNHFVFLASMWREFLDSDTFAAGRGSTVTKVVDGEIYRQRLTGIAGVANTGTDRNWTGYVMLQANWYAFGRLAWDPNLSSKQIATEWIKSSLTRDPQAVATIVQMMLTSHEAVVNYMTPLGLHHLFWGGHHYGPAPWWDTEKRDDWNPVYYHKADAAGIGFDRTKTGSNTVSQYHPPVRREFADLQTCPEKFLLWFHHVSWDYRMKSGRTLWDELALHYQRGVDWVRNTKRSWATLKDRIDPETHAAVAKKLEIQERDAIWWRDACLLYFQTFSQRPLPAGVEPAAKPLAEYKAKALAW